MQSAGPGRAHPVFLVRQPRAAFPELTISGLRLFLKRRTRLRPSTSRSNRSAAFPGSSATAAQAYQVDGAISRTQLRPALADGLRRLRSQNLPDRRTRHRQIPADPDQPPLRRKWRSSPIIAEFEGGPALGEGWRMPRNPGSTDDRHQRSIKCSEKCLGIRFERRLHPKESHFCTPSHTQLAPQREQKPHCNAIGRERDEV